MTGLTAQIDTVLARGIEEGYPAISMLAYRRGESSQRATGFTSLEHKKEAEIDAVFRLASITKLFTQVLTQCLLEENRLSLHSKIVGYLPDSITRDIPHIDQVEVEHLLSHSSGVYNFTDGEDHGTARDERHLR